MSDEQINDVAISLDTFLKRYIKNKLSKYIYEIIELHNKNNKNEVAVISGGDAIFYYVDGDENDLSNITKDFDIKFVKKNFDDWKEYNKNKKDYGKMNYDKLLQYHTELADSRKKFVKLFLETLFQGQSTQPGRPKSFEYFVDSLDTPIGQRNLLRGRNNITPNTRDTLISSIIKEGIDKFNSSLKLRMNINSITIGGDLADVFFRLDQSQSNTQSYKFLESVLFSGDSLFKNYGRIGLFYEINVSIENKRYNIYEGILDANVWSPIIYGFEKNYNLLFIIPSEKDEEIRANIQNEKYVKSILFKQLDFIEPYPDFYVVSLGFILWDTVRMANNTYEESLDYKINNYQRAIDNYETKRDASRFTRQEYDDAYKHLLDVENSYNNKIKYHKKYAKKYSILINSIFTKLRCVEPFISSSERCEKVHESTDDMAEKAIQKIIKNESLI